MFLPWLWKCYNTVVTKTVSNLKYFKQYFQTNQKHYCHLSIILWLKSYFWLAQNVHKVFLELSHFLICTVQCSNSNTTLYRIWHAPFSNIALDFILPHPGGSGPSWSVSWGATAGPVCNQVNKINHKQKHAQT